MALAHNSKVADKEPSWGSVDKTKLPRIAFADMGEPEKKSTWGFPHHWVQNGKDSNDDGVFDSGDMFLSRSGLRAARAASGGARSGKEASAGVKSHLAKHAKDIGMGESLELADICEWVRSTIREAITECRVLLSGKKKKKGKK